MELPTEEAKRVVDSASPDGSSEIARIFENAQRQVEEQFRKRMEDAIRAVENSAIDAAREERDQAVLRARTEVTSELQAQFDQTLLRTTTQLQSEFEEKLRVAREQWDEEKDRIREQMNLWRTYAEVQRLMIESNSQAEILSHFLQSSEAFAPNLAIYVVKADGLALWKTRGTGPFPEWTSRDTSDPEVFFRPIAVRERTVAAISARQPFSAAPLEFLSGCLERAVEAFGMRLQHRGAKTTS
jgi:hypothetical protein